MPPKSLSKKDNNSRKKKQKVTKDDLVDLILAMEQTFVKEMPWMKDKIQDLEKRQDDMLKQHETQLNRIEAMIKDLTKEKSQSLPMVSRKGLANLGMTCYFNAAVQSIYQTPNLEDTFKSCRLGEVIKIVLRLRFQILNNDTCKITQLLCSIFDEFKSSSNNFLSPLNLIQEIRKKSSQFQQNVQHDSNELLLYMLAALREEESNLRLMTVNFLNMQNSVTSSLSEDDKQILKVFNSASTNCVEHVFGGQLIQKITCLECGNVSETMEPFLDICLPIVNNETCKKQFNTQKKRCRASLKGKRATVGKKGKKITATKETKVFEVAPMEALGEWVSVGNRLSCNVDSCLRAFTSPSKLMDENKYRCDVCSNKKRASVKDKSPVLTDAVKQYLIYSAPNVLVLCLKRFYQTGNRALSKKETVVTFDMNLNLSPYCSKKEKIDSPVPKAPISYCLYGLISHSGNFSGGHYIAYVKDKNTNCWFLFNDDKVNQIQEETVLKEQPYLLFYNKV